MQTVVFTSSCCVANYRLRDLQQIAVGMFMPSVLEWTDIISDTELKHSSEWRLFWF